MVRILDNNQTLSVIELDMVTKLAEIKFIVHVFLYLNK